MFAAAIALLPTLLKYAPRAAAILAGVQQDYESGKISAAEADARAAAAMADADKEIAARQSEVVIAEIKAEGWLQRNWRPIVALTAFFSYWYVIIGYPHMNAWGWPIAPTLRFGEVGLENLFWLTVTCVGGYIGGRSAEKIARIIKRK